MMSRNQRGGERMSNEVFNHNPNQSSVDWVIGEIMKHQMTFYGTSSMPLHIIEKGKAMHKEEIREALIDGAINERVIEYRIPHYYNETFGGSNEQ